MVEDLVVYIDTNNNTMGFINTSLQIQRLYSIWYVCICCCLVSQFLCMLYFSVNNKVSLFVSLVWHNLFAFDSFGYKNLGKFFFPFVF